MLRAITDSVSLGLAWARQRRRIGTPRGVVKVNLGCGLTVAPGWINLDGSLTALCAGWPGPVLRALYRSSGSRQWYTEDEFLRILQENRFVHHNIRYGLPFADRSVDFLYSSHFLEHVFRDDAEMILRESYRVLKTGGKIRVCVPDLEYALELYRKGEKEAALKYFFATSRHGYFDRHQYMYDFELLEASLRRAGFSEIRRRGFREGEVPDIEKLDNRGAQTLFVEATRGA